MRTKTLQFIIFGVVVAIISTYLRTVPVLKKNEFLIKQLATNITYQSLKDSIEEKISKIAPDLNQQRKEQLINANFFVNLKNNPDKVKKTIKQNMLQLKKTNMQSLKWKHLIAADSYYYLGLTKNILKQGAISPTIKNGLYFNPLMMAPLGHFYYFDLHAYLGYSVYKIYKFFKRDISLEEGVAVTPLVLAVLCLIIFYFILAKIGIAPLVALISSLFFSLSPIFFQRSLLGWYDTDPWNVLFPALIILTLIHALDERYQKKERFCFIAVLSLISAGYSIFWSGWLIPFFIVTLTFLGLILFSLFTDNQIRKTYILLLMLIVYAAITFIIVALFRGTGAIMFSLKDALSRLSPFISKDFNLWPNAFLTVGELKKVPLKKILVLSGGRIFFILAVFGIVNLFRSAKTKKRSFLAITLVVFISSGLLLSYFAERFTILLVVPVAIAFAIFLHFLYQKILLLKNSKIKIALTIIMLSLIALPVFSANIMAQREQPMIFNDAWEKALNYIKDNTSEDAIINTWWAPGHFITAKARRPVAFDGATLEKPVGYWIAKALLSTDAKLSKGILRMLDNSSNRASEYLLQEGFLLSEAINILEKILPMTKDRAKTYLLSLMNTAEAETLLKLTHETPRESYVLIYNDLIEKTLALVFMANWDFSRAETYKALKLSNPTAAKNFIKERANNDYIRFLWSIAGGPLYYEKEAMQTKKVDDTVFFSNGISVNLSTLDLEIQKKDINKNNIASLVFVKNGKLQEKAYGNENARLALLLVEKNNFYFCVLADKSLINSQLFKLYYLDGLDSNNFSLFFSEKDIALNTAIKIFKINF